MRALRLMLLLGLTAGMLGAALVRGGSGVADASVRAAPSTGPYTGLGTWVDAFDYAPAFQPFGAPPGVGPESVDDMAALGVTTLYLQAAKTDTRSPEPLVDEKLVGELLVRAHRKGVRVVAWYLPIFSDLDADLAHVRAMYEFRSHGEKFDAIAIDVEWTQGVPDTTERNKRVVTFTKRVRRVIGGDTALGLIVYPAAQLDIVNPTLWPKFPYRKLAPSVDVWLPMTYWTFRNGNLRDAFEYTDQSVRRLRQHLRDNKAAVHPIGGIADQTSTVDAARFLEAVGADKAIGWSVYDYNTTISSAWPQLRAGPPSDSKSDK